MALNKAKVSEAAQKLVTQGKLKEAIAEYQKILKADAKDVNSLNTLGDLYVRLKNIPEALQYFTRLADSYVSDGFLVRGIAMYKKISKLDPANIAANERLAELYTMQGLFTEARAQYLQIVEACLKNKKAQEAIKVLQKVLDLEPDNLTIQQRLAQLYQDHGRSEEAAAIYRRVAERLLQREETEEALKWLEKATALAPENPEVLLTQARLLVEQGRGADAVGVLAKFPKVAEQPAALELLLKCRLSLNEVDAAEKLAGEIFAGNPRHFAGLLEVAEHVAGQGEAERAVALFQRIAEPALEHGEPAQLVAPLQRMLEAGAAAAADWLATAARKADDNDALVAALTQLAAQAFEKEEFDRARELYEELLQLAPDTPEFTERLNQVREKLGVAAEPAAVSPEAAAEAPLAFGEQLAEAGAKPAVSLVSEDELDPETRSYVTASLTDIDLYSSYGMSQKAIELAEQVVERVPGHLVANEKLLDFYLGSSNEEGIGRIAGQLEQLYRQKGNNENAERMSQLASKYKEKVGAEVAAPADEGVREVDLSAEWATLGEEAPAEEPVAEIGVPAAFKADEVREEIGFYIDQGMLNEARVALDRYAEQFPDEPVLAELRQRLEQAAAPAPAEEAVVAEEAEEPAPAEAPPAAVAEPAEVAAAPEESYEITLEEQPRQAEAMSAADMLSDLAGDLDASVPTEAPPPPAAAPPPPAAPAPASVAAGEAESSEGVTALAEVFDEFKQELGGVEEIEDIETHYNLGIAFKEMGLYDESVSEFQKVYKAAAQQKAYGNLIQCCTLLGLCFMEKGLPQIAVGWYERALKAPGIDPEGVVALRYDMGVAHEQAGNRKAALDCFMEVYGLNVDFRDVSDRIRELQQ
ncbi:MAG: tetratricopeptide repeat protein [Terriglobia bacterium]